MRVWNKTLVMPSSEGVATSVDKTFSEHARGMGGYPCSGYGSAAEFFATYFEASERLQSYDAFLTAHLPREARTLSIASGRCANEMRLVSRGYRIVCSDLEPVCPGPTRALFPDYAFMKWDAMADPIPADRFDAAICLSFVYLLSPGALDAFMERVRAMLAPGGLFILDSAGSPDHLLANVLHDVVLPLDARLSCALFNLRARARGRERRVVRRKHHGYRYADTEFIAAARRHGLVLEAISHMDFENEWMRMIAYRRVLSRVPFVRAAMRRVGRRIPYVRMFAFRCKE
jgi:SAM-dependent methyltransferase